MKDEIQPDKREQMFQLAQPSQFQPTTYQGPSLEPFLRLPEEEQSAHKPRTPSGKGK